jgi:hypothetical protein
MRFALATLTAMALLVTGGAALAQNNSCTTVVLHAVAGFSTGCTTTLDCTTVPPLVDISAPTGAYTVFMYIKNYAEAAAIQCAFDWPPTWGFGFGLWQCQTGQITGTTPTAPGARDGTISTAFNAISGGALAPIGFMVFNSIGTGCLSIIESDFKFGNVVLDFAQETTPLSDSNEGKICVDTGGINTCDCVPQAVEPSSWGAIKATYR